MLQLNNLTRLEVYLPPHGDKGQKVDSDGRGAYS